MPSESKPVEMMFPVEGIDLSGSFGRQRLRTTPLGKNVRTFDPEKNRARGGSRPGLQRFAANTVNGSDSVQDINYLPAVTGTAPGQGTVSMAFMYTLADRVAMFNGSSDTWNVGWDFTGVKYQAVAIGIGSSPTPGVPAQRRIALFEREDRKFGIVEDGALVGPKFVFGGGNLPSSQSVSTLGAGSQFFAVGVYQDNPVVLVATSFDNTGATVWNNNSLGPITESADDYDEDNGLPTSLISSGAHIYVNVKNTGICRINATTGAAGSPFIPLTHTQIATQAGPRYENGVEITATGTLLMTVALNRTDRKVKVVYLETATDTPNVSAEFDWLPSAGDPQLTTDGTSFYLLIPDAGDGFSVIRKMTALTVDWTTSLAAGQISTNIAYWIFHTAVILSGGAAWQLDPTTGAIENPILNVADATSIRDCDFYIEPGTVGDTINYRRRPILLAVAGGVVRVMFSGSWRPIGGATLLSGTSEVVRSAVNNNKMYYIDGITYAYYDPDDNTLKPWTAFGGALPVDSNGFPARLIATWRGRTALSGLRNDPRNIFFSAIGNPHDYNYGPATSTSTQAVALDTAPQGKMADVVTALIPFTDDILIVGCDRSIYLLNGDPLSGGQTDLVTAGLGMSFGNAWTQDPEGTIYFMSNFTGIWMYRLGEKPVQISQPIKSLLEAISYKNSVIRLVWDDPLEGMHFFVTISGNAQAAKHFFWERRTNAWWTTEFADESHNPLCCALFQGDNATERVTLIGGWSGYVYSFSRLAETDDGTDIESSVLIGPLNTSNLDELFLTELQGVFGQGSGDVDYAIYAGETVEEALDDALAQTNAAESGTWQAGRNYTNPVRVAGYSIYLRLDSTKRFFLETVRGMLTGKGRIAMRRAK